MKSRAQSPPPQIIPEMKFDLIPSSTEHTDSNPFRTSNTASPLLPRRNPIDNTASGSNLQVQTTLPKAKSLVSIKIYGLM